MSFFDAAVTFLLKPQNVANNRSAADRRRRFRPSLEALEDRTLPATFLVTNTDDAGAGSLRHAILDLTNSADATNLIATEAGGRTIHLVTALPAINKSVDILGPGADNLTVQRSTAAGTPNFRIFTINTGGTVLLSGLSITNGSEAQGGGVRVDSGTLNVNQCDFFDNEAVGAEGILGANGENGLGGAIYDVAGPPLTV